MAWIVFENPGEADIFALTTFGVSAKDTKTPIGFFGTGFKYAVAVLARHNARTVLQIGEDGKTVAGKQKQSRGEEFTVLTLGSRELGFTTQLGRGWPLWAAYRELYCNMLDEGGRAYVSSGLPKAVAGLTRVCVNLAEFEQIHENRSKYILETAPLQSLPHAQVHPGGGTTAVFYRGMRAMELPKAAKHQWNIISKLELTEDRVVKHQHEVTARVAYSLLQAQDKDFIYSCIASEDYDSDFWELGLDLKGYSITPSEAFLDVAAKVRKNPKLKVNESALSVLYEYRKPPLSEVPEANIDESFKRDLKKAKAMLRRVMNVDIDKYAVKIVPSLGEGIMGKAERPRGAESEPVIWLSMEAFVQGPRRLMGTLYEEYIHLDMGYSDMTRSLQNFLLDQLMTQVEEIDAAKYNGDM